MPFETADTAHPSPDAIKLTLTRRGLLRAGAAASVFGGLGPLRLLAAPVRAEPPASVAPCLVSARNSYPPLLQRFIDKLDSTADVFPTEVYVVELEKALATWSAALQSGKAGAAEALRSVVAEQIAFSSTQSVTTQPLRNTAPLLVERYEFGGPTSGSREGFVHAWSESLAKFAHIELAEFEIYGLRILSESPLRIQSDIHYDFVGVATGGNTREQRNGAWTVDWVRGSGTDAWLADRWTLHTETRGRLTGPGFQEITAQVLASDSPAAAQLAAGIDHYRTTLDAVAGLDVYGNHGVAVGDIDGSGFDSIYVCQPSGLPNRLLRNRGDGTFEDITDRSGTGLLDGTASAIFADFQNRGAQDLLVVRSGGPMLFHNAGSGHFEPRPDAFHFARQPQGTFTSAAVADTNRDGLLDVYFCVYSYYQGLDRYQFPSPYYDAQNGPPNFLFRNRGDGTFEDVTVPSGMDVNNNRFSFAAEWCDYDNDSWPDLYVANDFGRKNLYRNNRNGTFTDVAAQAGVEDYGPGMSTCWLDYDNDGNQDLYVANMWLREGKRITANEHFLPDTPENIRALYRKHNAGNSMYRNNGKGGFEDKTLAAGTERGGWSWSCGSWDVDNDGWPALYVTNGFVSGQNHFDLQSFFWRQVAQRSMEAAGASPDYEMAWNAVNELVRSDYSWSGHQRNSFYVNNRDGTFSDVGGLLGLDLRDDSRAFALSDFDGDGRLEFALKNRTGPQLRVLRNNMATAGSTLAVRLTGTTSNHDAIGAVVTVECAGRKQTKQLSAGSGFASQHTKELFFGLGDSTGAAKITVRWPNGGTDRYEDVALNARVSLVEGKSGASAKPFRAVKSNQSPQQAALPLPHSSATLRTWLAAPLYGPELKLTASNDNTQTLSALRGKVTVLLFLDFNCGESALQMQRFQQSNAELNAAGMTVFAVAVQRESTTSPSPGPIAILPATPEQLTAWNIQYRYLFDRRRDLSFPTAFLIDTSGAAVCVYQGTVTPEQIIADSRAIPATAEARLQKAMPYPGPYFGNPFTRDYFTYAVAFVEYGLLDDAEAALKQAIRQNPEYAAAWFNLGTVYLNKKQYPDAQKALREAVRLNRDDAEAWNNLGMIAGEQGSYDEALTAFRNAARANPNYLIAVQNMMQIYQYQQRPADAQKALEELIAKAPRNADLHLGLAMSLQGQNDAAGAQRELRTAIDLRPNFADAINNLGTVLLQTGDTAGALREFERCRQIAPDFDRPLLNEAVIYSRAGQPEKGRMLLQEFLTRHPDNADVRAMLQKLGE